MKINRSNFDLLLFVDLNSDYEGTFNVSYKEKIFNKEVDIYDTAYISEQNRQLNKTELTLVSQINKLVKKEFDKRGFQFDNWQLKHSPNGSINQLDIMYKISNGGDLNSITLELLEDTTLAKKSLSLARSISKRLLRELK